MKTRRATAIDVPAIAQVQVTSWHSTYTGIIPEAYIAARTPESRARIWAQVVEDPEQLLFVAEDETGGIVGFASAGSRRDGGASYEGELSALYLLPNNQRKGIGRALVGEVARALAERGMFSMLVWVLRGNPASEFYKRLGGQLVGSKEVDFGGALLIEDAYGWSELEPIMKDV